MGTADADGVTPKKSCETLSYEADKESDSEMEQQCKNLGLRKSLTKSKTCIKGLCNLGNNLDSPTDDTNVVYSKYESFNNGENKRIVKLLPTPCKSRESTEITENEYDADSESEKKTSH